MDVCTLDPRIAVAVDDGDDEADGPDDREPRRLAPDRRNGGRPKRLGLVVTRTAACSGQPGTDDDPCAKY